MKESKFTVVGGQFGRSDNITLRATAINLPVWAALGFSGRASHRERGGAGKNGREEEAGEEASERRDRSLGRIELAH